MHNAGFCVIRGPSEGGNGRLMCCFRNILDLQPIIRREARNLVKLHIRLAFSPLTRPSDYAKVDVVMVVSQVDRWLSIGLCRRHANSQLSVSKHVLPSQATGLQS